MTISRALSVGVCKGGFSTTPEVSTTSPMGSFFLVVCIRADMQGGCNGVDGQDQIEIAD